MSERTISEKLLAVQMELKSPKSQENKFGKYKYRSCEDILESVKPLCEKHKVCLTISDEIVEVGGRVYIKATTKLSDIKALDKDPNKIEVIEVTAYAREPEKQPGMSESQITGACSSYARKYALNGLFAIDDTKDADATNTHGKDAKELLNFDQILEKYNTAKNVFELRARKKKYMPDVMACGKKEIEDLKSAYMFAEEDFKKRRK